MSPQALANYYLRFWIDSAYGPIVADNAPPDFRRFAIGTGDPARVHEMLRLLVKEQAPGEPDTHELVRWLAGHPEHIESCEKFLTSKKGKKETTTFRDILLSAYNTDALAFYERVRKFVASQLN